MNNKIRWLRYTRGAEGQPCINCGVNDGTTVFAHYQGIRSHAFGKGTGTKPHDICGADLCKNCHEEFDSYQGSYITDDYMRKIDLSERFLYCCMLTFVRRCEQGIVPITSQKRSK